MTFPSVCVIFNFSSALVLRATADLDLDRFALARERSEKQIRLSIRTLMELEHHQLSTYFNFRNYAAKLTIGRLNASVLLVTDGCAGVDGFLR